MVDENIEKMADLLRSGNTMLNLACPVCNNPIFRNKNGTTFCPTCNREILITGDKNHTNERSKNSYKKEQGFYNQNKQIEILNSLQEVIFKKLSIMTDKLKNETQLPLIKTYTKILLNCLEIINKILINRERV